MSAPTDSSRFPTSGRVDLSGRTFVVTGGNGGIGLGMAEGIVQAGGSVSIWGRNEDKNTAALDSLQRIAGEAGVNAKITARYCDVGSEEAVVDATASTVADHGRLDGLFANAGSGGIGTPFLELSLDEWRAVMDINLDTHEYTTAWIPALIDALAALASDNSSYEFLFDGQTLVIEDLLATHPEYRSAVQELLKTTTLTIGPVYSQPDWRMVSGELHVRNLLYGVGDAESLGGHPDVAWLVDTFGHVSQAPQLLTQAGIDAAFVWRGVPEMTPLFVWEGADGTQIPTVDLFSGYRNLYGVTKTPDIRRRSPGCRSGEAGAGIPRSTDTSV